MTKVPPHKKNVKPKNHTKHFFPIYPGILDYVERGDLSPFQLGIYVMIHGQANYGTGVWMGSAPKLLALAPRDTSLQSIQRALRHLVVLGLLKHFHVRGVRGNFAHLINKYKCRSGELMGKTLNADKSTSLDDIIYEGDAEGDALGDAERELLVTQGVTHLQEEEVQEGKKIEKQKSGAAKPAAPDPSARLYIEKIKKLSDSLTDSLVEKHQESWPEPPIVSFQFQKEYQQWADLDGIEYRDFQNLWRGAMRVAEWTVTPLEPKSPYGPFTAELIEQWAIEAANNPDVLDIVRDADNGILTLFFAAGFEQFRVGADEPDWFPYEEAKQEKIVEENPVVDRAMPDASVAQ
jgi:hypothetical protein